MKENIKAEFHCDFVFLNEEKFMEKLTDVWALA